MTSELQTSTSRRRREVRHGGRWGLCHTTARFNEVPVGTKLRKQKKGKKKDGDKSDTEIIMERFFSQSPCGYIIGPLRKKMRAAFLKVVNGDKKKVELVLERFPQVNTVMGELQATLPKKDRLSFGWTTNDEANTLFHISSR